MNRVIEQAQRPAVRAAMAGFRRHVDEIVDRIVSIQQVPAPTFHETKRAEFMAAQFRAIDLADVSIDALGNVFGRLPGRSPGESQPVVVSAHLDTVFAVDTDLSSTRKGNLVYGPGIGDNATGLGGLLAVAGAIHEHRLVPAADVWFVANVREEGLGDLGGMRAVVDRFGAAVAYIVVEGGLFGQLSHQAAGVRRFLIEVTGEGGHSWGSFGTVSAIHVLGRLIAAIDDLAVPTKPKTTFNIGLVEGGLSVNSIAPTARLWLDLRSEDREELERLVAAVHGVVQAMTRRYPQEETGINIAQTLVGSRPAGMIPRDRPLVMWAETALSYVGCDDVRFIVSSTDANIPLSRGYDAVCLGLTQSGNSHRPDEYIEPSRLPAGLSQLLLVTLAAAG